jgi:hypothetical protein
MQNVPQIGVLMCVFYQINISMSMTMKIYSSHSSFCFSIESIDSKESLRFISELWGFFLCLR